MSSFASKFKRWGFVDDFVRYQAASTRNMRAFASRLDRASTDEAAAIQQELLQRVLRHAQATRYGAGRGLTLGDWPILDKQPIRERPTDFVRKGLIRIPASTTGTSGQPLQVVRSFQSAVSEQFFIDRLLLPHGYCFRSSRVAVLRGNLPAADGSAQRRLFERLGESRLVISSPALSQATIDKYVGAISAFRPDILWIYPTAGDLLAALCVQRGARIRIPLVLSSSEMLSEGAFERIGSAFGARVIDYYGQAERVSMAWSDRPGHWYFAPAYGYVGLVPSESDESSHGNRTARVIATGYWNDAMPLVRYDTGDTIEFESSHGEAELREIAVGKRPFWRVHGRNNDFILSPDGAATQNLDHIIRDRPSIRQAQFVQSADFSIRLKIIPNGVGLTKSVLNDIHRLSRERIPGSVGFSVEVVNHLEPGPGEKVAFVVRDRSLRPSHA